MASASNSVPFNQFTLLPSHFQRIEDLKPNCAVCLLPYTLGEGARRVVSLECGHIFCQLCVSRVRKCPSCRANISSTRKVPAYDTEKQFAQHLEFAQRMKDQLVAAERERLRGQREPHSIGPAEKVLPGCKRALADKITPSTQVDSSERHKPLPNEKFIGRVERTAREHHSKREIDESYVPAYYQHAVKLCNPTNHWTYWRKAVQLLYSVKAYPDLPEDLHVLCNYHLLCAHGQRGRLKEALALYEEVSTSFFLSANQKIIAKICLAMAHFAEQNCDRAIDLLNGAIDHPALEDQSWNDRALCVLAKVHFACGRPLHAITLFEAIKDLEHLSNGAKTDRYESLGSAYYADTKYEKAIAQLNKIKDIPYIPTRYNVRGTLGLAYFKTGCYPEAIPLLEEVVGSTPDVDAELAKARYCLAVSHEKCGHTNRANELFSLIASHRDPAYAPYRKAAQRRL